MGIPGPLGIASPDVTPGVATASVLPEGGGPASRRRGSAPHAPDRRYNGLRRAEDVDNVAWEQTQRGR